jgi:hypothetical protein
MAVKRGRPVIGSEQLDAELHDLVEEAARYGKRAERAAVQAGESAGPSGREPTDPTHLVTGLREALEDEVTVAHVVGGESEIEPTEQDHEIAKRALVHIRLQTLRQIAKDLGVPETGNLDAVTDAIAHELRADKEAIAELVVRYEDEPAPERNLTSRLFQLREDPDDLPALSQRLVYITGRYIRTGIARWFIVRSVDATQALLRLEGIFRFFRADAAQFDEDLTLTAHEQNAAARLVLRAGEPVAEIEAKGEAESKALMAAFEGASSMHRREVLAPAIEPLRGQLATWHTHSVFLVDLLHSRFRDRNIEILDLNTAGFKTERRDRGSAAGEDEESRPRIRSVRFEGRHLLDSRPACELLSAGQQLVQLGMTVRFQPDGAEEYLLPLTVKMAADHVVVIVGFGVVSPKIAQKLRSVVTAGVRRELRSGLADPPGLERLARQVRERADAEQDPTLPTIFAPEAAASDVENVEEAESGAVGGAADA